MIPGRASERAECLRSLKRRGESHEALSSESRDLTQLCATPVSLCWCVCCKLTRYSSSVFVLMPVGFCASLTLEEGSMVSVQSAWPPWIMEPDDG